MPELPEVETVARSLRPRVVGRVIERVETSGLALRKPVDTERLHRACVGARVEQVERVGKYLVVRLHRDSASEQDALLVHLGMSGQLLVVPSSTPRPPHTHVALGLASSSDELRYVDPRRFGVFVALRAGALSTCDELRVLGVDPLSGAFTADRFHGVLRASRRELKTLLLDQQHVAGLGNIYVCEALFRARLSPRRHAVTVGAQRAAALHAAIREVLTEAIARRGTSFSDYVDADGNAGENQLHLAVYGREGQPCRACQTPVRRVVQGARSSFYCPRCQR